MGVAKLWRMYIVTGQQMAEIDRLTIQEFGLDGQVLMETAGRAVADWLGQRSPHLPVAFLCGPGNNGGDGWVAARAWTDLGGKAVVFFVTDRLEGDAQRNYQRALKWGIEHRKLEGAPPDWAVYGFVVDALFGTGLKRDISGPVADWIDSLPSSKTVAVDIPSGVDSASGAILGTAVRACATITFGLPKLGQLLQPGASYCGNLVIKTIGFPSALTSEQHRDGQWVTHSLAQSWLPAIDHTAHKGKAGKLLVIAGSRSYPGAGCLASLGALRSGAGLVYSYAPSSVLGRLPLEAIPIESIGDHLSLSDLEPILNALESVDAFCIGPGVGHRPESLELIRQLLENSQLPAVVDADALRALPERLKPSTLLTPHAGELARLLDCTLAEVANNRLGHARQAAARWNCNVLLKGDPTLVCCPDGRFWLSNQGTPVLAQGGSGDVLSGVASALLARGLSTGPAGALAAYLHGKAGQLGQVELGLGAQALSERLPEAFTDLIRSGRNKSGDFATDNSKQ